MNFLYQFRFALCAFNFGAIAFVQWVQYPLFAKVNSDSFISYHRSHVSRTSILLGTTLFLEMLINVLLFLSEPTNSFFYFPLLCLSVGWIVTFTVSVPQHRKLEKGFENKSHRTLLFSNLVRVFCWGGAVVFLLIKGQS
jgi:hypothetical protein